MGTHPIFESDFDCLTEKCFEMSLTGEELSSLVSLTEKSQDHSDVAPSLESLSHSFLQEISSDSLFRVLSGLVCLLECDLLSPQARFAALTVLLESKQRPESSVNFVTQKLLQDLAKNSNELKFIKHTQNGKREYIRQHSASKMVELESLPLPSDPSSVKDENEDERTRLQKSAISSIIPDPEQFSSSDQDDETLRKTTMHMILCEPNFGKRILDPQFITIPPPLYDGPEDELEWLFPSDGYIFDVEWDDRMCQNNVGVTEIQRLYEVALQRKLENEEEQKFKEEIKNEPKMLDMIGLSDEMLPLLVEYNPMITVEILMIILKNKNKEEIKRYLRQITNINVTLQSLEVVNRLVTQVELPSDFIPYYITRCTKTCEDLEDRLQQGRLVRLVCVFLRALINNSLFDIKDCSPMLIEVQGFCIQFSRIREAAGLFRLLKTMDNDKELTANQ